MPDYNPALKAEAGVITWAQEFETILGNIRRPSLKKQNKTKQQYPQEKYLSLGWTGSELVFQVFDFGQLTDLMYKSSFTKCE
jgi:hypothetical protein